MKSLFFSLIIITSFSVSGQCAKKQRKQLLADCASEQQKQEEALTVFSRSKADFDAVKKIANGKIDSLKTVEKHLLTCFFSYSGVLYQLKELKAELPSLKHTFKSDEVPVHSEFLIPIESTLSAVFVFEKVSEKTDLGDLSVKEQNKVLCRKMDEYKRCSLSNAIRLGEMKEYSARISAFLPRMDSMFYVYKALANDFTSDSWKLQDRLKQEEAVFRKKGPGGFPQVYFLTFPEVFPGFVLAEQLSKPIENTFFEYAYPAVGEHQEARIFESIEGAAVFPGGREKMDEFLSANLRYPASVREGIISGRVYVKFVVSEKGEISAAQVLKGIPACPECGEEAIRLINSMPNWIPAKNEGKTVKSYVGLPIKFE
jgi:TonB family protein